MYSKDLLYRRPLTGIQAENCYFLPSLQSSRIQSWDFASEHCILFRLDLHQLAYIIARRPEYKARERIHRDMADSRLLAIPTSWRRVAASNPNWGRF